MVLDSEVENSLGQLTSHPLTLVSAKGKTKEVYNCDIVVSPSLATRRPCGQFIT